MKHISRAHKIEIRNCLIHDSANLECDFVDARETAFPGSDAILTSNKISKATGCFGNRTVIHFGQDGGKVRDGILRLENNTIRTPFPAPVIQLSAAQARVVLNQNVVENSGKRKSQQTLIAADASTASDQVQGRDNKISLSFAGAALEAMKLEHTTFIDSTTP